MEETIDTKSLLKSFRDLRYYQGEETPFWQEYLKVTAIFCKSPLAVLFQYDGLSKNWSVKESIGLVESYKENQEEIIFENAG